MTTWVQQDLSCLLTPEELAERAEKDALARAVWKEKHRPENIVMLSSREAPRPFLSWFLQPKKGKPMG